jgi:hypothetical protein
LLFEEKLKKKKKKKGLPSGNLKFDNPHLAIKHSMQYYFNLSSGPPHHRVIEEHNHSLPTPSLTIPHH